MGYMIGEWVVVEPLTDARTEWLAYVLTKYGVSSHGADEFVKKRPVTSHIDRERLLDVLNRVVEHASYGSRDFRGKG